MSEDINEFNAFTYGCFISYAIWVSCIMNEFKNTVSSMVDRTFVMF